MSARTVLILAPLGIEARSIGASLGIEPSPADQRLSGDGARCRIALYTVGIRASRLPSHLLTERPFGPEFIDCLIVAGLAGGLDPSLAVGDVVIDCDDKYSVTPCAVARIRRGRIHTARDLVATPADKAALFRDTGALAVDMEADIIRRAVADRDVPLIGIRAISDTADISLPAAIADWIDPVGRPRPLVLARDLLRRPRLVADARRLRRDTGKALHSLGIAVRDFVNGLGR